MTPAYDIHGPSYRPENVRIVPAADPCNYRLPGYVVTDFDGRRLSWHETYRDAEAHRKSRAGVIKAALTRRANKKATR